MLAHGLNPDYFYLLDEAHYEQATGRIACLGAEVPELGAEMRYACKCHQQVLLATSVGACGSLLGVLLGLAHENLPLAQVTVTVTRYVERPNRSGANRLGLQEAERIPIAELLGSLENAQALVEEAWRTIHWGNAQAVLLAPITGQVELFGGEVAL